MDKKIGKLLGIYLISMPALYGADISLQVLDQYGQPTVQVAVGVPFIIEAAVEGDDAVGSPVIDRLNQLHVDDQGLVSTIRTTINGKSSSKKMYRYVVRASKKGSLMVGPARIETKQGISAASTPVTVQVMQQIAAQRAQDAAVILVVPQQEVVVGQKVELAVRFYYQNGVSLLGISEPQLRGAAPLAGPYSGTHEVDGVPMNYLEWRTEWYPTQPGTMTLPAVRAAYKVQRSNQRGPAFDIFSSFFDSAFEQKYVYSQALAIQINPLPPTDYEVHAVGVFKHARMSLDRTHARQGDGVVLRLTIEGSGNLSTMPAPRLSLPEGLTWYESNQSVATGSNGNELKTFEYIVQGGKPGRYTIPAHQIPYYHVEHKKYEKVTTQPITLTIEPLHISQEDRPPISSSTQKNQVPPQESAQPIDQVAYAPAPYAPAYAASGWQLSWRIFFYLISAIAAMYLLMRLWPRIYAYARRSCPEKEARTAFARTEKKLRKMMKEGNAHELYHLFMQLFALRLRKPVAQLDEEVIIQRLKEGSLSPTMINEWQEFFNQCARARFFSEKPSESSTHHLLRQADQWLMRLKDVI